MGRKKGRDISGWLALDKPAGMTSSAAVNRIRFAFGARKAGHAGTLDPLATGLLAVAFGEATKTVPYVTDALKAYTFRVRFGEATNTDDSDGEIIARSDARPSDDEIRSALPTFAGEIMQVPPKFSAVKIDGKRAYSLAREGGAPEIQARPTYIDSLELTGRPDADHADLEMVCGKGGYVRSIARDLGEALGCLGHVSALKRIWSGPFSVEEGVSLEAIEGASRDDLDRMLLPLERGLSSLPEAKCTPDGAVRIRMGNPGAVYHTDAGVGEEAWGSLGGRAVAVGVYLSGMLHPTRVFRVPEPGSDGMGG